MTISRRDFAKLLGMTPLAAKVAGDAEIARLTGIASGAPATAFGSSLGPPMPMNTADDYNKARIAAAEYAKHVGLPEFVKESMRRNSLYVGVLDPDLAAKRSWSMSVKILTQRQRNYERNVESFQYGAWASQSSMMFKKITGWDWPW